MGFCGDDAGGRWADGFGEFGVASHPVAGAADVDDVAAVEHPGQQGVSQLVHAITSYIDDRNRAPKPFVRTATVKDILANVNRANTTLSTLHWSPGHPLRLTRKRTTTGTSVTGSNRVAKMSPFAHLNHGR